MAEMLGAFLMKKIIFDRRIGGGPDKSPVFIPPKKAPEAPKTASVPLTPGNMPTDDTAGSNAAVKDEKRRILKAMPTATEKEFAGDKAGDRAPVQKKRLLGAGKSGRDTTGAVV